MVSFSLISITFLLITTTGLWAKKAPYIWMPGLVLFGLFGMLSKHINLVGIVFIIVLMASYYAYSHWKSLMIRILSGTSFFILTILMLLHKVPGIENWMIFKDIQLAPDSIPYSLYFNFDSPFIGISILLFALPLLANFADWKNLIKKIIPLAGMTIIALIILSYLLGYIRFNPKIISFFWIWVIHNLFFTCITEEGFFRGFLQNLFCEFFSKVKYGQWIGVAIASVLFGIAHFAGGPKYIFLATIAGLFYGTTYLKTKRIEASILVHFLLNTTHFLLFSYPALI